MSTLNKIIKWFKAALEGPDGKASHQKLLVVYMTILFTFVVISSGIHKYDYPPEVYHIIAGTILGQSAIRAWQSVRNHESETKNKQNHEENIS